LTIGSSTIGRAFASASRKALRPAATKAISFESTGWCLPSLHRHAHILHRKASDGTCGEHGLDALLHGRDEVVGNDAALDLIDELEAGAARQWLDAQIDLAELAGAAGLLLVARVSLGIGRDRLGG